MQEYEKYGNNCMQIAKVLSTWTPAQIKKHAECFFKQNLKKKLRLWNDIESLSHQKKNQILCNNAGAHKKQRKSLPPGKKVKILETDADAHKEKRESLSPED